MGLTISCFIYSIIYYNEFMLLNYMQVPFPYTFLNIKISSKISTRVPKKSNHKLTSTKGNYQNYLLTFQFTSLLLQNLMYRKMKPLIQKRRSLGNETKCFPVPAPANRCRVSFSLISPRCSVKIANCAVICAPLSKRCCSAAVALNIQRLQRDMYVVIRGLEPGTSPSNLKCDSWMFLQFCCGWVTRTNGFCYYVSYVSQIVQLHATIYESFVVSNCLIIIFLYDVYTG